MIFFEPVSTITLGPLTLQVWGMFVAFGILLSSYIITRTVEPKIRDQALSLAFSMIVWGIVGARIVHVALYAPEYYLTYPLEIFALWHGGLSSFGGILGAAGVFAYRSYIDRSLRPRVWYLLDRYSFAALYGWLLGRIGCVMIHDHPGVICNCALAFTVTDTRRLDMAFLEILALLPLAIVFLVYRKRWSERVLTSVLLMYYGSIRFFLDFFRARDTLVPDARYIGLTPAQYIAIVLVFLGASIFFKFHCFAQKK